MHNVCIPNTTVGTEQDNWDYLLSNFKPDIAYIYNPESKPVSNTNVLGKGVQIKSYAELPQDQIFVFLSPTTARQMPGTESLLTFNHKDNMVYIVGSNTLFVSREEFDGCKVPEHMVYIPTDTEFDMFNWTALAVCLWDRRVKGG